MAPLRKWTFSADGSTASHGAAKPMRARVANPAWLATLVAAALTAFSATLPWAGPGPFGTEGTFNAEWYLYLLGFQVVLMAAIVATCGFPKERTGRAVFVAANLTLIAVAVLVSRFALRTALFHGAQIAMRILIAGAWITVILGFPIVVWMFIRSRRGTPSGSLFPAKLWLAALMTLLVAEPVAALVERVERSGERLAFRSSLAASAAGELRIAAVGESTMAGFPYNGRYGIPEVAAWQLRQMYPERKVIVENLARDGMNLRKAIQSLQQLTTKPDLLLLYSGHNEFFYDLEELWTDIDFAWERYDSYLNWSPLFRLFDRRLLRGEAKRDLKGDSGRRLIDRNIATQKMHAVRLERFRSQLEQLAAWCMQQGIPCLWFVPAGSESDFEPNRSHLERSATDVERRALELAVETGRKREAAGDRKGAAKVYRDTLVLFPNFAELEYRLAECLASFGEFDEAREFYARALEHDGQPIRMTGVYRRQVQEVAEAFRIPVVNVADVLRRHAANGILGRSVFVDYVHPNLRAYFHLGMATVATIRESGLLESRFGPPKSPAEVDFAASIRSAELTGADLARAYLRVAEADDAQRKLRYESSRLEADSRQYREWSRRLESGEIVPGQSGTESFR